MDKSKKHLYILFNKSCVVLSNFVDPDGRPTFQAYVPVPDVYAAGRLDYESEGALILTNDGPLISRITQPDHHIPITSLEMVLGVIMDDALAELSRGVIIEGMKTKRCHAIKINDPGLPERDMPANRTGPLNRFHVLPREGRKRQVRRITDAVGFPTRHLNRVGNGGVTVEGFRSGERRNMVPKDLESLKSGSRARA